MNANFKSSLGMRLVVGHHGKEVLWYSPNSNPHFELILDYYLGKEPSMVPFLVIK